MYVVIASEYTLKLGSTINHQRFHLSSNSDIACYEPTAAMAILSVVLFLSEYSALTF